jgi:hypothetical protein
MLIFTPEGFISVVATDSNDLRIWARDKKSLYALAGSDRIECLPDCEYPYSLTIDRGDFLFWLTVQVSSLIYTDLEKELSRSRGRKYAKSLRRIQKVMHLVEDATARIGVGDGIRQN